MNKNLATPESLDYELGVMSLVNSAVATMPHDTNKPAPLLPSDSNKPTTATSKDLVSCDSVRSRVYSDFNGFHDYIQDENLDDLNTFGSSNEEDVTDDVVFYNKLKVEGKKRLRLEQENANLKRQISTLKEEMSIIKSYDSVVMLGDNVKKEGEENGVSKA